MHRPVPSNVPVPRKKLPPVLYVTVDVDGDESYLLVHDSTDGIDNNEEVGVYELVQTKRLRVTRELK